jgi:hypothetical protein
VRDLLVALGLGDLLAGFGEALARLVSPWRIKMTAPAAKSRKVMP